MEHPVAMIRSIEEETSNTIKYVKSRARVLEKLESELVYT